MGTKYKYFRPLIRSRHPSHSPLRKKYKKLPLFPFRSLLRFGSTTERTESPSIFRVELNSIDAIRSSSNKYIMKKKFSAQFVRTAQWYTMHKDTNNKLYIFNEDDQTSEVALNKLIFPLISKHLFGSRGRGNIKHNSIEEFTKWINTKNDLHNYIFEVFHNYNREYRLHVTSEGCFYTCRKMLRSNTAEEDRWKRNDSTCVWILEDNELFSKPVNWKNIVTESVKALKAVGLDFGAIDLKIQGAVNAKGEVRKNPDFIIIEINSAPSFGELTLKKYMEEIPRMLNNKYEESTK